MEPYYYNHMDRERQSVYRAMHQGLLSLISGPEDRRSCAERHLL